MELDDVCRPSVSVTELTKEMAGIVVTSGQDKVFVCLLSTPGGPSGEEARGLHTLDSLSLSSLTLSQFRDLLSQQFSANLNNGQFSVLYNGRKLGKDGSAPSEDDEKSLSALNVKANTIVHIIPQRKPADPLSPSKKTFTEKQIVHLSLALRTAFLSTAFARTVESLGSPETLETLFAIAPQLRNDLVGTGIIQSAHMILQFSEPEPLKKLAATRPWVVDALNFIAATVHGEKKSVGGPMPRGLLASQLLNPAMLGDEDEEEEMAQGQGQGQARGVQRQQAQGPRAPPPAHITREQLSQALNQAIGGSGAGAGGGPGSSAGLQQLHRPQQLQTSAFPRITPVVPIPRTQGTSLGSVDPSPTGALTGDMVARAMFEALNQLPPDQRADQLNAFREMARQVAAGGDISSTGSAMPQPEALTPQAMELGGETHPVATVLALRQMREVGIQDERLSLLALNVSGGDVGTAVELILSGWQGEGAESESEQMDEGPTE